MEALTSREDALMARISTHVRFVCLLVLTLGWFPPMALGNDDPNQERNDLYGDPLPDGAVARMGTVRFRVGGHVGQVAFSADNKMLAAVSRDGAISLWDAAKGKEIRRIEDATYGSSLAISPNGKVLVTGYGSGLHRWDLATWNELPHFTLKEVEVEFLLFAPDAKTLAAVARLRPRSRNIILFLDAETGNELHRKHSISPSLAFAPDSQSWAYADGNDK